MDALRVVCLPQGLWIIIPFYQQEKLFSVLTACIQLCFFIHLLPHPHHPFLSCVILSSPGSCLWFKVFSRCIAGRGETGRNNCSSLQLLPLQHLPFAFSLPIPRCCGAGLAAWGIQLLQCVCAKLWQGHLLMFFTFLVLCSAQGGSFIPRSLSETIHASVAKLPVMDFRERHLWISINVFCIFCDHKKLFCSPCNCNHL